MALGFWPMGLNRGCRLITSVWRYENAFFRRTMGSSISKRLCLTSAFKDRYTAMRSASFPGSSALSIMAID